ncbi:MAG: LPS assembly lipoprotein LptE [Rhodospirillaceae bacterium]
MHLLLPGLVVLGLSLALSACGFKAMYADHNGAGGMATSDLVVTQLSQVDVRPIAERRGMVLRQQLSEKLHPGGIGSGRYDLQVRLASRTQELGVRKDSTTSRANLILTANYILWDGTKRLTRDRVRSTVSYNILDDQYATIASEKNAEARALKQISDEIRVRLAVYFERLAKL